MTRISAMMVRRLQKGKKKAEKKTLGQLRGVVSASDSKSGGRGFDSRPCHVAIALGKQFTLTFPSPPTCKMDTQLQASNVLVCWSIGGAALWRHSYAQ
ncbi:hypothetical protein ElyMa_002046800 [Elysia marginata]|uniref:Uncharacterized protein n=1 Tax=Elysia marginata TaxID=1093978 RepID=A0AAV4F7H7_9GAST|nr:hypothetical protein ElyMa_002046800 [Elysia marginata]